ncbi:MAG: hypothetical protein K0S35_3321, partial [Geminicoccaceae bacterium]|nr:hypothetical protein [Geminicoccaceae bacterium]
FARRPARQESASPSSGTSNRAVSAAIGRADPRAGTVGVVAADLHLTPAGQIPHTARSRSASASSPVRRDEAAHLKVDATGPH